MKAAVVLLGAFALFFLALVANTFIVFIWLNWVGDFGFEFKEIVAFGGLLTAATSNFTTSRN